MSTLPADPPAAQSVPSLSSDVRAKLAQLPARYDNGAIPPAVFSVVRSLQVELAWIEHRGQQAK